MGLVAGGFAARPHAASHRSPCSPRHARGGTFQFGGKLGRLQVAASHSHADLRRQQMLSAQADIAQGVCKVT